MLIHFYFRRVDEIKNGRETAVYDGRPPPLESRSVHCASLARVRVELDSFTTLAVATGVRGRVLMWSDSPPLPGFLELHAIGELLNP